MNHDYEPVVFVVPGDLHLTEAGRDNHRVAARVVEEVNNFIRPDFVQFIGDNVQHAQPEEFRLFRELADRLEVTWYTLVGDHDVEHDSEAAGFRAHVGETFGSLSLRGFRFIRLNTQQHRPLGISEKLSAWFRDEVDAALESGERVVVFQHNYPYQIWESFDGPGISAWREIVQTRRVTGIISGHTHYFQIANDGRNSAVAVRSIGDPEGGAPGYLVGFLHGDDYAITYRAAGDDAPLVLITHPRAVLLATEPGQVVRDVTHLRVRGWARAPVVRAEASIDAGKWFALQPSRPGSWQGPLGSEELQKGDHGVDVRLVDSAGREGRQTVTFAVDPTGRFTAVPGVEPRVTATAFC
jgi:3',5'-cyclic-AMP phosphodiesterase